jgi:hypothetical protein
LIHTWSIWVFWFSILFGLLIELHCNHPVAPNCNVLDSIASYTDIYSAQLQVPMFLCQQNCIFQLYVQVQPVSAYKFATGKKLSLLKAPKLLWRSKFACLIHNLYPSVCNCVSELVQKLHEVATLTHWCKKSEQT